MLIISITAGKNERNIAGLATFFKVEKSKESPALTRIMIKAIFLFSEESERRRGSRRLEYFDSKKPRRIPSRRYPTSGGIRIGFNKK